MLLIWILFHSIWLLTNSYMFILMYCEFQSIKLFSFQKKKRQTLGVEDKGEFFTRLLVIKWKMNQTQGFQ